MYVQMVSLDLNYSLSFQDHQPYVVRSNMTLPSTENKSFTCNIPFTYILFNAKKTTIYPSMFLELDMVHIKSFPPICWSTPFFLPYVFYC